MTVTLFALFLGFAIALALFWWFLTEVLPLIVVLFMVLLLINRIASRND